MSSPIASPATSQLIAYGLLMAGAAVVGKLMIDGLVGDIESAKQRRAFIGPVRQVSQDPKTMHVHLSDVVRFTAAAVSFYTTIRDWPVILAEVAKLQAQFPTVVP